MSREIAYPYYRYPHVYSTFDADAVCRLCGQRGAYAIQGSAFCDACVASGQAYGFLLAQGEFDSNEMELPDHPPIRKWQEWPWPTCCDHPMVYVCELSKETIRTYAGDLEPDQFIEHCMGEPPGAGAGYYRGLRNVDQARDKGDYDLMLHYFECGVCGTQHIQFDAS
jgi:hypothetical protein